MDFLTGRGPSCSILEKEYYRIHYSIVNCIILAIVLLE